MLASVHLPSPAGMSNSVARRRTSPLGGISPAHLPSPAGTTNSVARRRTLPLGEISPVHLPSPAGTTNSVARRRTSPLGEISPVHLPSPAGMSNSVARRRTSPLGEISPGHLPGPAGLSNPVAASVARTACVHARFIWKFFLLLQMPLSPWRLVGVVNILKRPGPLCRRAAAIAEGRADFRRKAFHRGGAERSHPKAAVVKSAFEPSLVCRFAGNAALLPGEQATPFGPFPGLAASKRRILRGILQTLPVTAFQAQARIYGGRLQNREIPAGY